MILLPTSALPRDNERFVFCFFSLLKGKSPTETGSFDALLCQQWLEGPSISDSTRISSGSLVLSVNVLIKLLCHISFFISLQYNNAFESRKVDWREWCTQSQLPIAS